jgi:glycosyltransferase involved in cell wall biosynthesis
MLMGVPVAATRAGGIPEMIEHKKNGLLSNPGDADGLAHNLERLLTDLTLRKSLPENAMEKVKRFDMEKTIDGTAALYEKLVSGMEP